MNLTSVASSRVFFQQHLAERSSSPSSEMTNTALKVALFFFASLTLFFLAAATHTPPFVILPFSFCAGYAFYRWGDNLVVFVHERFPSYSNARSHHSYTFFSPFTSSSTSSTSSSYRAPSYNPPGATHRTFGGEGTTTYATSNRPPYSVYEQRSGNVPFGNRDSGEEPRTQLKPGSRNVPFGQRSPGEESPSRLNPNPPPPVSKVETVNRTFGGDRTTTTTNVSSSPPEGAKNPDEGRRRFGGRPGHD